MSETQPQPYATQADLSDLRAVVSGIHWKADSLRVAFEQMRTEIAALKAPIAIDVSGVPDLLNAANSHAPTYKPLNPADLPADQLLTYNQIVHLMGPDPLRRATVEKYALNDGYEKRFPRGFRRSPKTAVVWRAGDIAQFFNCKPSTEVAQ